MLLIATCHVELVNASPWVRNGYLSDSFLGDKHTFKMLNAPEHIFDFSYWLVQVSPLCPQDNANPLQKDILHSLVIRLIPATPRHVS